MRYVKYIGAIVALWLLFAICCILAPIIVLPVLCIKNSYGTNFIKSADRLIAAMLGYTGHLLLSTELSYDGKYKIVRYLLTTINAYHCTESALNENAYCRLKDHKLGAK